MGNEAREFLGAGSVINTRHTGITKRPTEGASFGKEGRVSVSKTDYQTSYSLDEERDANGRLISKTVQLEDGKVMKLTGEQIKEILKPQQVSGNIPTSKIF